MKRKAKGAFYDPNEAMMAYARERQAAPAPYPMKDRPELRGYSPDMQTMPYDPSTMTGRPEDYLDTRPARPMPGNPEDYMQRGPYKVPQGIDINQLIQMLRGIR